MIKEKFTISSRSTSVNIVQTQIESIRNKDITKTGIRIYENDRLGIAGAIGKFDELKLEQKAIAALENNIPYPYLPESNLNLQSHEKNIIIPENELLDEIELILNHLQSKHPQFIFSNKFQLSTFEVGIENDQNVDLSYLSNSMTVSILVKEKSSVNIIDGAIGWSGRTYDRQIALDLFDQFCSGFQKDVKLPNEKKVPVVFLSSDSTPTSKMLQDLNGQLYGTGSSLFSGKIGEQLFNDGFSLRHSLDPETEQGPFFDAEGVVNINKDYSYPIITDGVLKAVYTDKKTAAMFDLPRTGSATGTYDTVPQAGLIRPRITPSNSSLKELLDGRQAVLVSMAAGGDFTPTGEFASPVQLSFLFDGEKIIGRLPQIQISSNMFKMFGEDYIGMSKDKWSPLSEDHYLVLDMAIKEI